MLTILLLFTFWVAIAIMIIFPLILVFALGSLIAEKLELDDFSYCIFMIMFYILILCILILI